MPGEFLRVLAYLPPRSRGTFRVEIGRRDGPVVARTEVRLDALSSNAPLWCPIRLALPETAEGEIEVALSVSESTGGAATWGEPALLSRKSFKRMISRAAHLILTNGAADLTQRLRSGGERTEGAYDLWAKRISTPPNLLRRMAEESSTWTYRPTFSFIMDATRTNPTPECLESLRDQAYPNWKLFAVGASLHGSAVKDALKQPARTDERIVLSPLPRESDAAAAANAALTGASGDFICWLMPDDTISPETLFEAAKQARANAELDLLYTDEDARDTRGTLDSPDFKPDWAPEYFLSRARLGRLCFLRRTLAIQVGGFRANFAGALDFDLALRACTKARRIGHIAKPLLHRSGEPEDAAAARRAVEDHLLRLNTDGEWRKESDQFSLRYRVAKRPLVSILLPTAGHWIESPNGRVSLIGRCAKTIANKTDYENYELLIFDNGNLDAETLSLLADVPHRRVTYKYKGSFNFAAKMNFALRHARGEQVVFISDDVLPADGDWLTAMLEYSQQPEIGGVGCKLFFPNGTIQHVGVAVFPAPFHPLWRFPDGYRGYHLDQNAAHECAAVTAACFMSRRSVLEEVGGMDEQLTISFNDVDLCLRIRQKGYRIIYTPHARLIHDESATLIRHNGAGDVSHFNQRWPNLQDPYYSPNLAPEDTSCGLNWNA